MKHIIRIGQALTVIAAQPPSEERDEAIRALINRLQKLSPR